MLIDHKIRDNINNFKNNYNEFKTLKPGKYIAKCVKVETHVNYEIYYFDIAEGEYIDYFKNKTLLNNKNCYPSIKIYLTTEKSKRFLMHQIAIFEQYDPNLEIVDTSDLNGKKVCAIFSKKEYRDSDGNIRANNHIQLISPNAYNNNEYKFQELIKLEQDTIRTREPKVISTPTDYSAIFSKNIVDDNINEPVELTDDDIEF